MYDIAALARIYVRELFAKQGLLTGTHAGQTLTDYCPKDTGSVLAFQAKVPRLKKQQIVVKT